jgi:hypothetical protein
MIPDNRSAQLFPFSGSNRFFHGNFPTQTVASYDFGGSSRKIGHSVPCRQQLTAVCGDVRGWLFLIQSTSAGRVSRIDYRQPFKGRVKDS